MGDALTDTTSLATVLPTLVSERAIPYYEKHRLWAGLFPEHVYKLNQGESTLDVNQLDTLTFALRTQATTQASETFTTTKRGLTPVTHGSNVVISVESIQRSGVNIVDWMADAAATAWAHQEDAVATYSYAATYADADTSGPDHLIGADSTALTAALGRQAVGLLLTAGAKPPYHWVIDPIQFEELMRDSEAKQFLHNTRGAGLTYAATLGVNPDRYLGDIYGAHVWVADAMIETGSGLFSIMAASGSVGKGWRELPTPTNPNPGELCVDMQWHNDLLAYRIAYSVCQHISGLSWMANNNRFMVALQS